MPEKALFREEDVDKLHNFHSAYKKTVAKYHACRLDFFYKVFCFSHNLDEVLIADIKNLLSALEIVSTLKPNAVDEVATHSLFIEIEMQQKKLIVQGELVIEMLITGPTQAYSIHKLIVIMKRFDLLLNRLDVGLTASLTDVDQLTGLLNRTAFERTVKRQQAHSSRSGETLNLALIDADHFKEVNDTYGHNFGDYVLEELADCFEDNTRPFDSVFRYGGEEFLVLLPSTNPEQAEHVMNRLREAVAKMSISNDGVSITQTVSIGVASLGCSEEPDEAIERADQALYKAKETGRNKVVLWQKNYDS
ncbi:GGDEF domain-containing protein [Vibrio cholerae]|uniref:GGDEF domain-containing protein n=1 Tax=Vibrio cholerae TaxID=666 RepID=UPI00201B24CE|nr:GGDEF domain-containing protein [Vibrio cholerae]EJI2329879.1 GGDEF domain-containing protein [Vibrio cholerae]ELK6277238.1 GGDEF domain-containing protein [Vibrio cholerae]MCL5753431.1 GGDEF domain-containing protein [Vibrio cholerae]